MIEEILKKVYENNKNLIINGDLSISNKHFGLSLVNEMIKFDESLFIVDPKKEYINQYYDLLKEKNYNIVIINYNDLINSEGWNILEYPYKLYKDGQKDNALKYLEQISKEIFYEKDPYDPFWTNSASDLFIGVTLGLFEDGKENEINLNSISRMFNCLNEKINDSSYLEEYFKTKDSTSLSYIYASNTILSPDETRRGIISVAKQKLRLLVFKELLNKQLNKTTFSFDDIVNKKTAIFCILENETTYANVFVPILIKELYLILVDKKINNKFNFVLNDFNSLNNIDNIISIINSNELKNIKFTIFTEDNLINDNNLFNKIIVTDNNIELIINGEKFQIENNEVELKESKIEYPKLNDSNIKIFDLKKFLSDKKDYKIEEITYEDLDALKKKIDEKIKELDEENNS